MHECAKRKISTLLFASNTFFVSFVFEEVSILFNKNYIPWHKHQLSNSFFSFVVTVVATNALQYQLHFIMPEYFKLKTKSIKKIKC